MFTEAIFTRVTFSSDWKRFSLVCKAHIDETMNVCLSDWPGWRVSAALDQSEQPRKHGEVSETSLLDRPAQQGGTVQKSALNTFCIFFDENICSRFSLLGLFLALSP